MSITYEPSRTFRSGPNDLDELRLTEEFENLLLTLDVNEASVQKFTKAVQSRTTMDKLDLRESFKQLLERDRNNPGSFVKGIAEIQNDLTYSKLLIESYAQLNVGSVLKSSKQRPNDPTTVRIILDSGVNPYSDRRYKEPTTTYVDFITFQYTDTLKKNGTYKNSFEFRGVTVFNVDIAFHQDIEWAAMTNDNPNHDLLVLEHTPDLKDVPWEIAHILHRMNVQHNFEETELFLRVIAKEILIMFELEAMDKSFEVANCDDVRVKTNAKTWTECKIALREIRTKENIQKQLVDNELYERLFTKYRKVVNCDEAIFTSELTDEKIIEKLKSSDTSNLQLFAEDTPFSSHKFTPYNIISLLLAEGIQDCAYRLIVDTVYLCEEPLWLKFMEGFVKAGSREMSLLNERYCYLIATRRNDFALTYMIRRAQNNMQVHKNVNALWSSVNDGNMKQAANILDEIKSTKSTSTKNLEMIKDLDNPLRKKDILQEAAHIFDEDINKPFFVYLDYEETKKSDLGGVKDLFNTATTLLQESNDQVTEDLMANILELIWAQPIIPASPHSDEEHVRQLESDVRGMASAIMPVIYERFKELLISKNDLDDNETRKRVNASLEKDDRGRNKNSETAFYGKTRDNFFLASKLNAYIHRQTKYYAWNMESMNAFEARRRLDAAVREVTARYYNMEQKGTDGNMLWYVNCDVEVSEFRTMERKFKNMLFSRNKIEMSYLR